MKYYNNLLMMKKNLGTNFWTQVIETIEKLRR